MQKDQNFNKLLQQHGEAGEFTQKQEPVDLKKPSPKTKLFDVEKLKEIANKEIFVDEIVYKDEKALHEPNKLQKSIHKIENMQIFPDLKEPESEQTEADQKEAEIHNILKTIKSELVEKPQDIEFTQKVKDVKNKFFSFIDKLKVELKDKPLAGEKPEEEKKEEEKEVETVPKLLKSINEMEIDINPPVSEKDQRDFSFQDLLSSTTKFFKQFEGKVLEEMQQKPQEEVKSGFFAQMMQDFNIKLVEAENKAE